MRTPTTTPFYTAWIIFWRLNELNCRNDNKIHGNDHSVNPTDDVGKICISWLPPSGLSFLTCCKKKSFQSFFLSISRDADPQTWLPCRVMFSFNFGCSMWKRTMRHFLRSRLDVQEKQRQRKENPSTQTCSHVMMDDSHITPLRSEVIRQMH